MDGQKLLMKYFSAINHSNTDLMSISVTLAQSCLEFCLSTQLTITWIILDYFLHSRKHLNQSHILTACIPYTCTKILMLTCSFVTWTCTLTVWLATTGLPWKSSISLCHILIDVRVWYVVFQILNYSIKLFRCTMCVCIHT